MSISKFFRLNLLNFIVRYFTKENNEVKRSVATENLSIIILLHSKFNHFILLLLLVFRRVMEISGIDLNQVKNFNFDVKERLINIHLNYCAS